MLGHGLNISNEEIETIVTYLGSAPAAQDDEVAVAQDDEAPAFDEAAAANLVNASCTTCHDLTGIERGLYPADEWRETVTACWHGLNISNEEIETISRTEAPAFDEAAAANLVNASCTTCHDLTDRAGPVCSPRLRRSRRRESGQRVVYDLSRSDRHRAGPVSRR